MKLLRAGKGLFKMILNKQFLEMAEPAYIIDSETNQEVMINVASCDPLTNVPTINEYILPPWVVYSHDGIADILPAGRPGHVLENIPLALAEHLVNAANLWRSK